MQDSQQQKISVAIFCPQSKAPTKEYLDTLHAFLYQNEHLKPLLHEIKNLGDTWSVLASERADIAALSQGPRYMQYFSAWADNGESGPVSNAMSGILSLPLLVVIQICQYIQYLQLRGIKHSEFLTELRHGGGAQGYCGGLLPAIALACSRDEADLVKNAAIAMRVALAVGAYGELGDDENVPGPTTIVVRLKRIGQGDEIVSRFPGAYVSAITDPKTISIVGPVPVLAALMLYAQELGLPVQGMHLRGKVHNPENADLAKELCSLCDRVESLQLPEVKGLQIPVRSNSTGRVLVEGSLTHELVSTILASRCEWYNLLTELSQELSETGESSHTFALFGIGDCIPLMPFHKQHLKITKLDVLSLVSKSKHTSLPPVPDLTTFPDDAIAIVGAAVRVPGANDIDKLWKLMARGTSAAAKVPLDRIDIPESFRASQDPKFIANRNFYGNFAENVDHFDHAFFRTNPKEAAYMDPQQRILLELAYQAMDSSGYMRRHQREAGDPVGCFIGASFVEYLENTSAHPSTAYTATGTIRAFLCGKISYYFGWSGPSEVIDTACSSSLVAIHRACKAIQTGECPMALAGGVNVMSGIHNYLDLGKAGFLSPTGQCKPFDGGADGYCRADGAGLVVLKLLKNAIAEGDQILGVIPAIATNQGGLSPSITIPSSPAQVKLYQNILRRAGMRPEHVTYVEAHGTGTQAGDPLEIASIREVFGAPQRSIPLHIGSLKGNIGHSETAAGVASLIKVIAMLKTGSIPPLASFTKLNPKIPSLGPDNLCINVKVKPWEAPRRVALVNSYGAAGSNAALLCSDYAQPLSNVTKSVASTTLSFMISAASIESLLHYSKALEAFLLENANTKPTDLAFTLSERRKHHRFRWTTSQSSISNVLQDLQKGIEKAVVEIPQKPKGVVLVFAGQSKQYVGLDESLFQSNSRLRHHVSNCNEILTRTLGFASIVPAIFQSEPIGNIVVLQCATFSMQYACACCWIDAGLKVDATIGHSFGELTAMVVSGVLTLEDGLKLVASRATLMQSKWGPDRGSMLAIHADRLVTGAVLNAINTKSDHDVEIACYNSENSQVIVGTEVGISNVEALLANEDRFRGIKSQRINVSHGFHSKFTEPLLDDLGQVARSLLFRPASLLLETCTVNQMNQIPPERVVSHTRDPVYFVDAIQRIEKKLGPCVWLEAGMASPVISMVKRAVAQQDIHFFQDFVLKGTRDSEASLAAVTTSLWRQGISVSPWSFITPLEVDVKQIWLPPYQFQNTSHWLENTDHAAEERRKRIINDTERVEIPEQLRVKAPKLLVEVYPDPKGSAPPTKFRVDNSSERFTQIVSGHAVRDKPLCPASMYMECAAMALEQSGADLQRNDLCFEDLSFMAPLGIHHSRQADITIDAGTRINTWSFSVGTSPKNDPNPRRTLHCQGKISLTEQSNFNAYQRLISDSITSLTSKSNTERLRSGRAYELFSRVVTYAEFLKGISSIILDGSQALAEIEVPACRATNSGSTVTNICDTVPLDMFIQVVGLLINSSGQCSNEKVFIATGIDKFNLSRAVDLETCASWTVYAKFTIISDDQATGDVFIMTRDGVLVMTSTGVRFSSLKIATLEKMLGGANADLARHGIDSKKANAGLQSEKLDSKQEPRPEIYDVPLLQASGGSSTSSEGLNTPEDSADIATRLQALMTSYAGMETGEIDEKMSIAELGIDSLAAVELSDEIQASFNVEVAPADLMTNNCDSLLKTILGQQIGNFLPKVSLPKEISSVEFQVDAPHGSSEAELRALIASYTGLSSTDITDDSNLAELGVDSLAAVELTEDIRAKFGKSVGSEELMVISYGKLVANVCPSSAKRLPTSSTSASNVASVMNYDRQPTSPKDEPTALRLKVLQMLSEASGADPSSIDENVSLQDIGIDSLSAVELKSDLEALLSIDIEDDAISLESSVKEFFQYLKIGPNSNSPKPPTPSKIRKSQENTWGAEARHQVLEQDLKPASLSNPVDAIVQCGTMFSAESQASGFVDYWKRVSPLQNQLLVMYILQAFRKLGADLWKLPEGQDVPSIHHLPKHSRVMARFHQILEKHDIIQSKEDRYIRTSKHISDMDPSDILHTFRSEFAAYGCEAGLMALTGPKLAGCLTGEEDPMAILFGTVTSQNALEDYYTNSPMLATLTQQLVDLVLHVVSNSGDSTVRILEVGAGFGGTTGRLVKALQENGRSVRYTFTDISPKLVNRAATKFADFPWMDFQLFNLEQDVQPQMVGKYDIVIGTNCVHATTDKTASVRRIKQVLNTHGLMVLSEVTQIVDWYDIVYGLLDGWWLAKDGSYPLQPAESWMKCFRDAGFASVLCSGGLTLESQTQQLLLASKADLASSAQVTPASDGAHSKVETVVYKETEGVKIHADVYFPILPPQAPMPIALMIHGGGFMTLSKKAIRPRQTAFLLSNGVLPVSLDYRLCPEVNLIDGPMADVRDAYGWAKTELPKLLSGLCIVTNPSKVVLIGWSSGGQLAMSAGWTSKEIGLQPPTAVLSFYSPTDFESGDLDGRRAEAYPERQMAMHELVKSLSPIPITSYDSNGTDTTGLGWVKPGDPRSELVLSLFKEGNGLSLMLNGLSLDDTWMKRPAAERIAYISPMAQVRSGAYLTPTFIIHGDMDEIVPFSTAVDFVRSLEEHDVKHGFLPVRGVKHIHDIALRPGTERWRTQIEPGYTFLFKALDIL